MRKGWRVVADMRGAWTAFYLIEWMEEGDKASEKRVTGWTARDGSDLVRPGQIRSFQQMGVVWMVVPGGGRQQGYGGWAGGEVISSNSPVHRPKDYPRDPTVG
jgi:hypothetical protein